MTTNQVQSLAFETAQTHFGFGHRKNNFSNQLVLLLYDFQNALIVGVHLMFMAYFKQSLFGIPIEVVGQRPLTIVRQKIL